MSDKSSSLTSRKPHNQRLIANDALVLNLVFDPFPGFEDRDRPYTIDTLLQQRSQEQAGVGGSDAKVSPKTEGQVRIGSPIQTHFLRGIEHRLVLVGGR